MSDSFNYDSNGLIVQHNGNDAGDCAGREGDYWFAKGLNGLLGSDDQVEFDRVISLLQPSPGIFVRSPTQNPVIPPAKSWNDPSDFSRDQTMPIILALGQNNRFNVLNNLLKNQLKRFGAFQNGDLPQPETISAYIRAYYAFYLYPILYFTDLGLLAESIIRCIQGRDLNNVSDDINHTLLLIQAQNSLPTLVSLVARKIYKWFRPGGVQAAWNTYFNPKTGANPFNELYKDLISKL